MVLSEIPNWLKLFGEAFRVQSQESAETTLKAEQGHCQASHQVRTL